MARGYFVTGTDTGVGKTLITAAIAAACVRRGKRVGVMKPCETGCQEKNGSLIPADALILQQMAQSRDSLATICPYRFRQPLAPLVAATYDNETVDPDRIRNIYESMRIRSDIILIEGAGGLLVPVTDTLMNLDLALMLSLPLLIVARLSLGTINHTLLTEQVACARGAHVSAIVLNQTTPEYGIAEETNPGIIKKFACNRVLGPVPYLSNNKRSDPGVLADTADTILQELLL
ncbi:MAG: dethiobiotin synthase [Desulfobacterota bacterium]|nr:dethiobiotin synthase [Thermodesulfobacteriota bacterium]